MEQILSVNESILNIIGKYKQSDGGYRFSHYAVAEPVKGGVLLFNTLTRELLLLSCEEYELALENEYLRKNWFVVPENLNDKQVVQMVRWINKTMDKEKPGISDFTIFTTMDCNARCFYCFQLGRKRIPMDDVTAQETADFIIKNNNGDPITIHWFGGEPLFNVRPIDIICQKLRNAGITFESKITTNGYLMNDENVQKCVNEWNIKRVMVSMDGTESVYNKAKRFIYKEGNPFLTVLDNIQRLLDNGIRVVVRVNMDFHNIEDLNVFAEDLAKRFGGNSKFYMYPHLIIDETKSWDEHHSLEEWNTLYEAKAKLEQKMLNLGIYAWRASRISRKLPKSACIADNSNSITITPDGSLGVCDQYSETELIGHLGSTARDQSVINSFRQYWEDIPECDTCFHYPQCIRLKKCPFTMPCIEAERKEHRRNIGVAMRNEYRFWLKNNHEDEE